MQKFTSIISGGILLTLLSFSIVTTSCGDSSESKEETAAMQDESGIPALLERKGDLAKASEWEKTKSKVAELKERIQQDPKNIKARLQLATIYMSEARVTGNSYYYQATIKILDGVIAIDPNNFEAYTYKASVAMSLHRFADAKQLAEKARSINPENAYVYGVLVDANVELGNYQEAIAMSDKMQVLKPSLEAYSRASYLREIYGDYSGSINAMKLAVQAGAMGSESAEWARVTLGDLQLATGHADSAQMLYETSLAARPNFPNAEMGLAKVWKARKNYDSAIAHTENAIRIVSESGYVSFLGDLYELKGDKEKSAEIRKDVVDLLEDGEKNQLEGTLMKHNGNRELAQAYMNAGEIDKALQFAKNDLELRPANIDANELVAWLYYMKGDYANAKTHAEKMLATNTQNANTLYKAGVIYTKAGDVSKGAVYTQKAKAINNNIDPKIALASK
jgi:Predicted N-acetylglucosaminyl transferase